MLTLPEIEKFYPPSLRGYKRFLLIEYLQHKIVQIVFESEYAGKLVFLGGTCLRIVHDSARFSEDIDFDNFNISEDAFEKVAEAIRQQLAKEGYSVEMKTVYKGAYHCYIRFPGLLYKEGLSKHLEEKILIQLDTEPQHFEFEPEKFLLNRFDVFTQILTTPKDLLLAQKFYTVINRVRNKGRDFLDIVFLLSLIDRPNYDYLKMKLNIQTATDLKEIILQRCKEIDMQEMARDVQPFLFNPGDVKKILLFPEFLAQANLK